MSDTPRPLARPADIGEAFALLTRLPVPGIPPRGAAAAWAWPLAGLAVALIAGLAGIAGLKLGLPPTLAAGVILTAQIALTGALHEDGLADSVDGLWGGRDKDRRLEIMKDSRIGSYGVLALGLSLMARWSALTVLIEAGGLIGPLLAGAALSRAAMAGVMAALPNARGAGLAAEVGRPAPATAGLAAAVALITAFALVGWLVLAAAVWIAIATLGIASLARAKIGGQTGDILGATQQLGEITALAVFASLV